MALSGSAPAKPGGDAYTLSNLAEWALVERSKQRAHRHEQHARGRLEQHAQVTMELPIANAHTCKQIEQLRALANIIQTLQQN